MGGQQDGYNPDLVEKTPSTLTTPLLDPEAAYHRLTAAQQNRAVTRKKTLFYAKNIIIVLLVIVIIAVTVGGVVGGTRRKRSLNSSSTFSTALSSTTSSSAQRSGTEQGGPGSVDQGSANRLAPAICKANCQFNQTYTCCIDRIIGLLQGVTVEVNE